MGLFVSAIGPLISMVKCYLLLTGCFQRFFVNTFGAANNSKFTKYEEMLNSVVFVGFWAINAQFV